MEDRQIIDLLFERNDRALNEIALKYGKLLFRVAENILHCREDSRECVNDTYFAVWNKIPPEKPDPFTAFICRIARNLSMKKLRYKNAQKRSSETLSIWELQYELADCSFEQKIDSRTLGRKIDSFLNTIDRESRIVFVKRYWFCDEIEIIARDMGMKESNVYQKLSRTRKKLRSYLEKEGMI